MKNLILIFILLFTFSGCSEQSVNTRTELIFNTPVTIALYDDVDEKILTDAFSLCNDCEQQFSKTISSSEVSHLNDAIGEFQVSAELLNLIETAREYSILTDDLFDISTYELTQIWDFKSENPTIPPSFEIEKALSTVGYQNILIENDYVTLLNGAKIDLGSLAKGYIADKVKIFLLQQGVCHATLNIGGNIHTIGAKNDDGDNWTVGIRDPFSIEGAIMMSIEVADLSVVTSGPYERNFVIDDIVYHHILDPNTGFPATSDLSSVTVISHESLEADLLSTSCYLIGLSKSLDLIENTSGTEAIFIDNYGNITTTSGIGTDIPINYFN